MSKKGEFVEYLSNFSKNLKILMREKGLKQVEVAEAVGGNKGTVSKWLNGKIEPGLVYIAKLLEILNCTFEELISD